MKKISIVLVMFALAISCQNRTTDKQDDTAITEDLSAVKYEIAIEGMTCTGCEETIEGGVMKIDGVESIEASHTDGKALVVFYSEKTDTTAISESITKSGYSVLGFKPLMDK